MTSLRRIASNRANSLLSTGPTTPSGKAAVAMNAIAHGLCSSKHVVHMHERRVEFDMVRDGLMEQLDPQTPWEQLAAERIIATAWRLRRVPAIENWLYFLQMCPGGSTEPDDTLLLAEPWRSPRDLPTAVANLNRHEAHLHRLLRTDLADYRTARQSNLNLNVKVSISPSAHPAELSEDSPHLIDPPDPAILSHSSDSASDFCNSSFAIRNSPHPPHPVILSKSPNPYSEQKTKIENESQLQ